MDNSIKQAISASIEVKKNILDNADFISRINEIVNAMVIALKNGNKIVFCGNGGSAADAQHLAAELSGRFYFDREPLNSEALHCNTSYLTAVANDYGYEFVYSRMVKATCSKGDILVGISTSGNSKNIINAFNVANELGITTVAFTGDNGGEMKKLADYTLNVPSEDTPRIQEAHIMIGHIICELVEKQIFGNNDK